jgi:vacuolar-type H+-ATPase subunit H
VFNYPLTVETNHQKNVGEEHYLDKNTAAIQNVISVLSDMETQLDELGSQVSEMKKKLVQYAETEAEQAKNEILDQARKEAEEKLEAVRASARSEAEKIISRGEVDTQNLRSRVSGNLSSAVDLIVRAVQSV